MTKSTLSSKLPFFIGEKINSGFEILSNEPSLDFRLLFGRSTLRLVELIDSFYINEGFEPPKSVKVNYSNKNKNLLRTYRHESGSYAQMHLVKTEMPFEYKISITDIETPEQRMVRIMAPLERELAKQNQYYN